MAALHLATTVLLLFITTAAGFECYLCNNMQASLQICDEKLVKQTCKEDRCGIFSFNDSNTGTRVYGKSCVRQAFCEDLAFFCKSVSSQLGVASECELKCCTQELCNGGNDTITRVDEDDDSESCDWVDSGSNPSLLVSGFLFGVCALYVMASMN